VPSKVINSDETTANFSPLSNNESPFILSHEKLSSFNIIIKDGRLIGIMDYEIFGTNYDLIYHSIDFDNRAQF
jgi:hypothetical protein